jgi:hypothetical protein
MRSRCSSAYRHGHYIVALFSTSACPCNDIFGSVEPAARRSCFLGQTLRFTLWRARSDCEANRRSIVSCDGPDRSLLAHASIVSPAPNRTSGFQKETAEGKNNTSLRNPATGTGPVGAVRMDFSAKNRKTSPHPVWSNTGYAGQANLMAYSESRLDYDSGLAFGGRALRQHRARERTYYRLMRLHYLAGDRAGAIRQFQRCNGSSECRLRTRG